MGVAIMKLGIIGAMEEEVQHLIGELADVRKTELMGMTFFEGNLGGAPVVVVKCGIGKVNAALCAGTLALHFGVTHVVNTGVAGSLDARIDIGDIVVSVDAVQHDFDTRVMGYPLGTIPYMGEDGTRFFATDANMRSAVVKSASEVAPEVGVHEGRIASGDQFISSAEQKELIVGEFGALCAEMEGAAIAQACMLAGIPCVIVRAISDKADGSAHMDYPTFEREAAARCARIVERMAQLI